MSELFGQLGINWKLLLSQGVNFFIVLAVLTFFVWRPLLAVMQKRKEKIEQGLQDSDATRRKLERADEMVAGRMTEADRDAVAIIQKAEKAAQEKSAGIVKTAEQKAEEVMLEAKRVADQREQEEFKKFAAGAGSLMRAALAKAVAQDPQKINEKLVGDAVAFIKKHHAS